MIDSPVLKLQKMASEKSSNIEDLLRMAYMIADKLDLIEMTNFFGNELDGYPHGSALPSYRIIKDIAIYRSYGDSDYVPVNMVWIAKIDDEFAKQITELRVIGKLSKLVRIIREGKLYRPEIGDDATERLNSYLRDCYVYAYHIKPEVIEDIIDGLRNSILQWALQLEKHNLLGDGLLFSSDEKREAQYVTYNTINNTGNGMTVIGDIDSKNGVVGGTVGNVNQQNITGDFNALGRQLKEFGYDDSDIKQLEKLIAEIPAPTTEAEVQKGFRGWIMDMTGKALDGGMNIAGSAATGLLTKAISQYFGIDM